MSCLKPRADSRLAFWGILEGSNGINLHEPPLARGALPFPWLGGEDDYEHRHMFGVMIVVNHFLN